MREYKIKKTFYTKRSLIILINGAAAPIASTINIINIIDFASHLSMNLVQLGE